MRNCNVCGTELVLHVNWWVSHMKNSNYECNKCAVDIRMTHYRARKRVKQHISS